MASVSSHPLCFLILLLLSFSATSQTNRNITLGSSLTSRNDNSSWESPSGEFAFGFQQIETGGFLLAIWFNKIPEKTIIWSANGNNLVQEGSTVQLTIDGRLVLNDTKGQQIWSADSNGTGVSYAAMLDTGNFVLASQDSAILWESFGEPTDTILPTQTLNRGSKLTARLSERDYSSGRFQFTLESDGNLVLYTTDFPKDTVNSPYWSSNTESGYQVVFNQSGGIYLTARNRSTITPIISNATSARDLYRRAILEYDGVFRQYVYPKTPGSGTGGWKMAWTPFSSYVPQDICMTLTANTGGGACGFNSYCTMGDDRRPSCECPQGYSFLDPGNKMNGCKQNFVAQSCDETQEIDLFDFIEMSNTDWPRSDYIHFKQVTEDECREACLGDCFCAVAIFRDGNCWKKRMPLSNGRVNPIIGGKALIKIRKNDSTTHPPKKKDRSELILTGSVLLGSSVTLNFLLLLVTLLFILRQNKKKSETFRPCSTMPDTNLRSFTYKELEEATDGFREELGRGSFGTVYKGIIAHENGNTVAVKMLRMMERRVEEEFKTELSSIGRTNHKNLVQLIGFCNEGEHRILVYEFMSNGSLASFLFGNPRPGWYRRIHIAFGTARGLHYLHEECSTQIIHCDIKPQNILLDDSFTSRICDFGLAKLLKTDQTQTTTLLRGTRGYVAPEWFKNKPITVKVDIYSFGIVLLELICCRKNYEPEAEDERKILVDWAYDCYMEGKLQLLVENDEEGMGDMKRLEKFVLIAIWCIQGDPSLRPTMKKVTQMLEGAVEVSVPPDPSSYI